MYEVLGSLDSVFCIVSSPSELIHTKTNEDDYNNSKTVRNACHYDSATIPKPY